MTSPAALRALPLPPALRGRRVVPLTVGAFAAAGRGGRDRAGAPGRARARLGQVDIELEIDIEVDGPTLPGWLLPGRHRCLQVDHARENVGPPR